MLQIYIISLENHIQNCKDALTDKNSKNLQSSAHDLKSLAYTVGANDPGQRAETIEAALMSGDETTAFNAAPQLILMIEDIIRVMKEMQQSDF
tara:strand:+ start:87021 stop:87299 length:279 start_codon:yes stop_codon:yes gene_type:complete